MNVKIVINAKETTKDDIRSLIQMMREWELKTPKSTIVGVLFDTDPKITSEQAKAIFEGIFSEGFFVDTHDPAVSLYTNIDAVQRFHYSAGHTRHHRRWRPDRHL